MYTMVVPDNHGALMALRNHRGRLLYFAFAEDIRGSDGWSLRWTPNHATWVARAHLDLKGWDAAIKLAEYREKEFYWSANKFFVNNIAVLT